MVSPFETALGGLGSHNFLSLEFLYGILFGETKYSITFFILQLGVPKFWLPDDAFSTDKVKYLESHPQVPRSVRSSGLFSSEKNAEKYPGGIFFCSWKVTKKTCGIWLFLVLKRFGQSISEHCQSSIECIFLHGEPTPKKSKL